MKTFISPFVPGSGCVADRLARRSSKGRVPLSRIRKSKLTYRLALLLGCIQILGVALVHAQQGDPKPDASGAGINPVVGTRLQRIFPKEALPAPAPNRSTTERSNLDRQLLVASSFSSQTAEAASVPGDSKNHVLGPNDLISIKVYQEPDLDMASRIDKTGTINYPLLGIVKIGGKTAQAANEHIRELLASDYLVNPQVNLTIIEYAKKEFSILGDGVQRPGTYTLPEDKQLTLQQAIALAGGYKPGAKIGRVAIMRLVGGEKTITYVDANAYSKDKRAKPFFILPDDHITIDERFF